MGANQSKELRRVIVTNDDYIMLRTLDSRSSTSDLCPSRERGGGGGRKPLQMLSGLLGRRANSAGREKDNSRGKKEQFYLSDDGEPDLDPWECSSDVLEPREALHSPYHAKTIDQDMHNLRLSRQDNPYLQVLASRECLNNENEDRGEIDNAKLVLRETACRHPLTVEEIHQRLVRSPPPVFWTRSRNSEPSFSRFAGACEEDDDPDGDQFVFQFPEPEESRSPAISCKSQGDSEITRGQPHHRFLSPFKKESALEILSGKFNLSPQPRRKPWHLKTRTCSEVSS